MTINSSPSRISSFNCPPNSKALVEYWVLELSIFLCATLVVFHIPVYLRPGSLGCGKVALSRWLLYAGEHDAGAPRPAAAGLRDMGKPGLHLSSPMNRKWQGFRGIRARNCFFFPFFCQSLGVGSKPKVVSLHSLWGKMPVPFPTVAWWKRGAAPHG